MTEGGFFVGAREWVAVGSVWGGVWFASYSSGRCRGPPSTILLLGRGLRGADFRYSVVGGWLGVSVPPGRSALCSRFWGMAPVLCS